MMKSTSTTAPTGDFHFTSSSGYRTDVTLTQPASDTLRIFHKSAKYRRLAEAAGRRGPDEARILKDGRIHVTFKTTRGDVPYLGHCSHDGGTIFWTNVLNDKKSQWTKSEAEPIRQPAAPKRFNAVKSPWAQVKEEPKASQANVIRSKVAPSKAAPMLIQVKPAAAPKTEPLVIKPCPWAKIKEVPAASPAKVLSSNAAPVAIKLNLGGPHPKGGVFQMNALADSLRAMNSKDGN